MKIQEWVKEYWVAVDACAANTTLAGWCGASYGRAFGTTAPKRP
jgi:hypothetical protein